MGMERWKRAPNRKAMPFRERYILYTIPVLVYSKGIVLQTPCKAGTQVSTSETEEILQTSLINLRHAWNQSFFYEKAPTHQSLLV